MTRAKAARERPCSQDVQVVMGIIRATIVATQRSFLTQREERWVSGLVAKIAMSWAWLLAGRLVAPGGFARLDFGFAGPVVCCARNPALVDVRRCRTMRGCMPATTAGGRLRHHARHPYFAQWQAVRIKQSANRFPICSQFPPEDVYVNATIPKHLLVKDWLP